MKEKSKKETLPANTLPTKSTKTIKPKKLKKLPPVSTTLDRVIDELAAIAFFNILDICAWDSGKLQLVDSAKLSKLHTSAIAEIAETSSGKTSVKVNINAKLKALEMLGKHYAICTSTSKKEDTHAAKTNVTTLPESFYKEFDACFPELTP